MLLLVVSGSSEDTCEAEGSCEITEAEEEQEQEKGSSSIFSGVCNTPTSLYCNGGSAQAYKPDAPLSSVVCRPELAQELMYKAASWPYTRRTTRKGSAPSLNVGLKIWSCKSEGDNCDCGPLDISLAKNASSVVEVWQTLPDGRYSSLQSSFDCRARVPLAGNDLVQFTSVAPGSTGIMAGLGPGGWESNPYGPPVIHLLLRVAGHAPLLVDLPALAHPKTLEQRSFSIGDWRGIAWTRQQPEQSPLVITSWEPNIEENNISLEAEVFVQQASEEVLEFCESRFYGFPSAFFLEPITACAPSLLDFFSL